MGFTLPSPNSPMEQARRLADRKKNIEEEISTQISILKANASDMKSSLVDSDGFPRADVDIYAVRGARVRIIELRNDLKDVTDAIGKVLEEIYHPALRASSPDLAEDQKPFAKVDQVAVGGPAQEAGVEEGDLIVKFGHFDYASIQSSGLQPLAKLAAGNENGSINIKVIRNARIVFLTLTPRKGWGGRGMLGCHIVQYSPKQ